MNAIVQKERIILFVFVTRTPESTDTSQAPT